MKPHPSENDLALVAGGEASMVSRILLRRHIRSCRECTEKVADFEMFRNDLSLMEPPSLDWNRLGAEIRANIRVGLEAGECVRPAQRKFLWNPRLLVAFASLILLVGASFVMKDSGSTTAVRTTAPVLESSEAGLELRSGAASLTLLNRQGKAADQTVSAQGVIEARYIDAGGVTINNAYLE